jgi:hypothetical protein
MTREEAQRLIMVEKLRKLIWAVETIELCNRAIAQYTEMGISGTPHDLEHRQMLADAKLRLKELDT